MNLLNIAASLMDGGDDLHVLVDEDGTILDVDHEYLRGQAELIVDAFGLSMDGGKAVIYAEILRRLTTTKVVLHTEIGSWRAEARGAQS